MGVDTYRKGRLVSRSQAEVSLGDGLGNNDLCFVGGGGDVVASGRRGRLLAKTFEIGVFPFAVHYTVLTTALLLMMLYAQFRSTAQQ